MKKGIAIGLAAITALSAAAYAGFGMEGMGGKPLVEYNEELKKALEGGDYDGFVDALAEVNPERAGAMTEEHFTHMVERMEGREAVQEALEAGDYEAFVDALEEVNPMAVEKMTEQRFDEMVRNHAIRAAVEEAVANHDYEAWAEAVLGLPNGEALVEIVDPEDFETLIELHEARMNSEFENPGLLEGALGMGPGYGKGSMGPEGKGRGPGMGPKGR